MSFILIATTPTVAVAGNILPAPTHTRFAELADAVSIYSTGGTARFALGTFAVNGCAEWRVRSLI